MIWCVEDDTSIRDIEVYALQSTGVEAKGFEDGDSFLSALKMITDMERIGDQSEDIAEIITYLEGKTAEEMAISLLEEEKEMRDNKLKEK